MCWPPRVEKKRESFGVWVNTYCQNGYCRCSRSQDLVMLACFVHLRYSDEIFPIGLRCLFMKSMNHTSFIYSAEREREQFLTAKKRRRKKERSAPKRHDWESRKRRDRAVTISCQHHVFLSTVLRSMFLSPNHGRNRSILDMHHTYIYKLGQAGTKQARESSSNQQIDQSTDHFQPTNHLTSQPTIRPRHSLGRGRSQTQIARSRACSCAVHFSPYLIKPPCQLERNPSHGAPNIHRTEEGTFRLHPRL